MKRVSYPPRAHWQKKIEDDGGNFYTMDGKPYWAEGTAYEFTAQEIDLIEDATNELHTMCIEHVAQVVQSGDYIGYEYLNDNAKRLIELSYGREFKHPAYLGRFDLGVNFAGSTPQIKMFEYNADTPTSLPESSVWQYTWQQEVVPLSDQFNSIHEKLIKEFEYNCKEIKTPLYFASMDTLEDLGNVHYMAQVASSAGYPVSIIPVDQIGWNEQTKTFRDQADCDIEWLFKLYPWEWLIKDEYGLLIEKSYTIFAEPPWKMLLSTKALLPLLWGKYKGHPNLLEAHFESPEKEWIRKPKLGREGANISRVSTATKFTQHQTQPLDLYDNDGYVLQEPFATQRFDFKTPVIGSWVIGHQAAGIGIREDDGFTTNSSRFVPHYFVE